MPAVTAALVLFASYVVTVIFRIFEYEIKGRVFKKELAICFRLKHIWRTMLLILICGISVIVYDRAYAVGLPDYIAKMSDSSTIYEEEYVDPDSVEITFPEEKKNVVWIYLESMENTFASVEEGGGKSINYIPGLTSLAKENVSFSNTEQLGGLLNHAGAGWTMGALLGSTSGVPYMLPVGNNRMDEYEIFMPGITTMGDVLEDAGYKNYFMCGSEGEFAGRQIYFEQHGNYEMYDYFRAIEDGVIPEDYRVFWGFEDCKLYAWAKEVLTDIASKDEPFNFTMLTVDTHMPEGYICELCEDTYSQDYANAIVCGDKQIIEFIEWIQQQEWYEDTVIVLVGDHLSMNNTFYDEVPEDYERTIYNCFLNIQCEEPKNTQNRTAYAFDLFPTTLAAMGAEIEGDKLGFGTNLFSDEATLPEQMGRDVFESETAKESLYYNKNFIMDSK